MVRNRASWLLFSVNHLPNSVLPWPPTASLYQMTFRGFASSKSSSSRSSYHSWKLCGNSTISFWIGCYANTSRTFITWSALPIGKSRIYSCLMASASLAVSSGRPPLVGKVPSFTWVPSIEDSALRQYSIALVKSTQASICACGHIFFTVENAVAFLYWITNW